MIWRNKACVRTIRLIGRDQKLFHVLLGRRPRFLRGRTRKREGFTKKIPGGGNRFNEYKAIIRNATELETIEKFCSYFLIVFLMLFPPSC